MTAKSLKRILIVLILAGLLAIGYVTAPASAAPLLLTVGKMNSVGGEAKGTSITRSVVFNGDFLPGWMITDVNITITFEHINDGTYGPGACASVGGPGHQGGSPYNGDLFLILTSPAGTSVTLVESVNNDGGSGAGTTYTDNVTYGGVVTVTFDDEAAGAPGAYPTSGTFTPVQPLSAFDGELPSGTWTLTIGDWISADPSCFYSYTLTINAESPLGLIQRVGNCELKSIPSTIYAGLDNSFTATGKGELVSLRFTYAAGRVAGWLAPLSKSKSGQNWTGVFANANSDGTIAIAPGEYTVHCFGPTGTIGAGKPVTVVGP